MAKAKQPERTNRTAFLNKFKKKTAGGWKTAAGAEAKVRGSRLPGGLIDAVARFEEWIGKSDAKGNPQFNLVGVVVEPEEHYGKKATIVHRIVESKDRKTGELYKSVQDKLDQLSSDVQLLGGETDGKDEAGLMDELDRIMEEKPYFVFNTAQFEGRDNVYIFIQGLVGPDYVPPLDSGDEAVCPSDAGSESAEDGANDPDADGGEGSAGTEGTGEAAGEEPADWVPAIEEVWGYKKNSKSKAVDLTVVKVDLKAKTVDLRDDDGKVVAKAVPWDKLIGDGE